MTQRTVPITFDGPPPGKGLDLARFYKRRRVQAHLWGYGSFLCFWLFARNVYAAAEPLPTGWDQATWLAFFGTITFALKTLDTHIKVKRDAKARSHPRPTPRPMALGLSDPIDTSELVTHADLTLIRDELDLQGRKQDELTKDVGRWQTSVNKKLDRALTLCEATRSGQQETLAAVLTALGKESRSKP
jgi:hypothetical protein